MRLRAMLFSILVLTGCVKEDVTPQPEVNNQPQTFEGIHALAMKGDYQAQRNLAYGYSTSPYPGQQINSSLACAWRIVIIKSGHEKADSTDISNKRVYCDSLEVETREMAEAQAAKILKSFR